MTTANKTNINPSPRSGGDGGGLWGMRLFIHFQYDGTAYHGWQIQPNANTVQEELQRALSTVLRQNIEVVGAGRTDTGVHARHMVAHFSLPPSPPKLEEVGSDYSHKNIVTKRNQEESCPQNILLPSPLNGEGQGVRLLVYKLNRLLPRDISILKIEPVADDLHARFSATKRTYHYYITTRKDPFSRQYAWQIHWQLDFDKMNEAAQLLIGEHDFASFCKVGSDVKTTICNVTEARWIAPINPPLGGSVPADKTNLLSPSPCGEGWGGVFFRISANRFLRNMVRAVVGTLIEVGRGRMTIEQFQDVLNQKSRCAAGESVPAHGLFLERVEY